MTNQVIPTQAVEAATKAFRETHFMDDALMNALEAAAPHMQAAAKAEALEDAIEWLRIPSQPGGGFAAGWLKIWAEEYRKGNL